MLDQQKQQRLRSALPLLLAVLPAIFTGLAIPVYAVDAPQWDEWLLGGYLDKFAQGTLSIRNLFEQQNEYRQFFPNLVFVALGWLTSWDVRYWMGASFILALLVSFNIYRLGKWSLAESPKQHAPWAWFVANLIIFSPVQFENWLQGQQLVYFAPIACFTTSLVVASARNLRTRTKFSLCAVASFISSFSSANGLLCWLLLLPLLAWSRSRDELWGKKWWIAAWLAGFVGSAVLYFHNYRTPGHNPLAALHMSPLQIASYYLITLGSPLIPTHAVLAALGGFVLLTLFCWFCSQFLSLRRQSDPQAQLAWLSLGAYSVLTAALITIGRIGLDIKTNLSPSRYTTFTIYLPVALVYLVPMMLRHYHRQHRLFSFKFSTTGALRCLCVALVVLLMANYFLGIRYMSNYRINVLYKKSCSLFVNVVDDKCLTEHVFPDIIKLKGTINPANLLGFIRPGLIRSNRVFDIAGTKTPENQNIGAFQSLGFTEGGKYVASGWAKLPTRNEPADAVLLAYAEDDSSPIIFAIGNLNNNRDIASTLIGRGTYGDSRWSESFSPAKIISGRVTLSAWAFDAASGKAYKLDGEHVPQRVASSKSR